MKWSVRNCLQANKGLFLSSNDIEFGAVILEGWSNSFLDEWNVDLVREDIINCTTPTIFSQIKTIASILVPCRQDNRLQAFYLFAAMMTASGFLVDVVSLLSLISSPLSLLEFPSSVTISLHTFLGSRLEPRQAWLLHQWHFQIFFVKYTDVACHWYSTSFEFFVLHKNA